MTLARASVLPESGAGFSASGFEHSLQRRTEPPVEQYDEISGQGDSTESRQHKPAGKNHQKIHKKNLLGLHETNTRPELTNWAEKNGT
eukprot:948386-Rhodomonas_salina.1